jgi:hypothetical protein
MATEFKRPGHYTKADRDKIDAADFAGPNKTFPIVTPQDVEDAADLHGHSPDPEAVKRRIIEIAKRTGKEFVAKLPKEWRAGMEMAEGFAGQWVEIFRPGEHTDNKGTKHSITPAFLESVVEHFDATQHEPPAVVGHPEEDAPAFGWVCDLRVRNGVLEAKFCDTDPQFEEMVESGKFKKRSAAFYLDDAFAPGGRAPALRHVGFLGAQPPAVKGLRNIHFNESAAITFDDATFSEGEISMKDENVDSVAQKLWEKIKSHFTGDTSRAATAANFSEADVKKIVSDAVKEATATFSETIETQKKEITRLSGQVLTQATSATRTELTAFCDQIGMDKLPPALRKLGVVEFMEQLAALPDTAKVVTISFSEEAALLQWFKNFLTNLKPLVAFGERFGALDAGQAQTPIIDPARLNNLRAEVGVKSADNGGAK